MVRNASNTIPSLVGLEFRTPPGRGGGKMSYVFLFFCLSRFFQWQGSKRHFTINALENGNDLGIVG